MKGKRGRPRPSCSLLYLWPALCCGANEPRRLEGTTVCSHPVPGILSLTTPRRLKAQPELALFPGQVSVVPPLLRGRGLLSGWGSGRFASCGWQSLPYELGRCEDAARQSHQYSYSPPQRLTPTPSLHREAAFLLFQILCPLIRKDARSKKGPCSLLAQRKQRA